MDYTTVTAKLGYDEGPLADISVLLSSIGQNMHIVLPLDQGHGTLCTSSKWKIEFIQGGKDIEGNIRGFDQYLLHDGMSKQCWGSWQFLGCYWSLQGMPPYAYAWDEMSLQTSQSVPFWQNLIIPNKCRNDIKGWMAKRDFEHSGYMYKDYLFRGNHTFGQAFLSSPTTTAILC